VRAGQPRALLKAVVLWLCGAAFTFGYWGWIGLVVGLFLGIGVGVVPMGLLALALHSEWEWFLFMGGLLVAFLIFQIGGLSFVAKASLPGD
jgi:hypothetical protein